MGNAAIRNEVLDLVYETAVDVGLWSRLLQRFADLTGGHSAAFRSYEHLTETGVVVTSPGLDATALDANFRRFADVNPLKTPAEIVAMRAAWRPGLKRDIEWLPKSEFVRTAYYNDFYARFDVHSDLSVGVEGGARRWTGIDVYRSARQGPFSDEDITLAQSVHPHLMRAHRLSGKLATTHGVGVGLAEVFDRSPHGLFLLDDEGAIRHLNAAAQRLLSLGAGLRLSSGRLAGLATEDDRKLQALIVGAAGRGGARRTGGAMGLVRPGEDRRFSIEVAPLPERQVSPLHSGPALMVCVTDLDAGAELSEAVLRELFGLTPAEVRVAVALFKGLEPARVAQALSVSLPTVRTHLAHIYGKTGATGQSDLSRLLSRLATA